MPADNGAPSIELLAPSSRPLGGLFLVACLVLAVLKLWLVAGDEVAARLMSYDDGWYLTAARQWYWQTPFDAETFLRSPGYPLFIALVRLTGLPLRVATELLCLTGAFALAAGCVKAGISRLCGGLVFVMLAFHPALLYCLNYVWADNLYAAALWLALACTVLACAAPSRAALVRRGLALGAALAVLWVTREERVLVMIYLALFAGLTLVRLRAGAGGQQSWREAGRRLALAAGIPAGVVATAALSVILVNGLRFGVFATSMLTSGSYNAMGRALLRVAPERPRRFLAVSRETRNRLYDASPSFATLRPFLEGELGRKWAEAGNAWTPVGPDEIPGVWFYWAVHDAESSTGYGSPAELAAFHQRVADEINAACDEGRLPARRAFSSFLDPELRHWVPHVPGSVRRIATRFVTTRWAPKDKDGPVAPGVLHLFDAGANRRAALTRHDSTLDVSGWACVPGDPLTRVQLRDPAQGVLASTETLTPRADVAQLFASRGVTVGGAGFRLQAALRSATPDAVRLDFTTRSGAQFTAAYAYCREGYVYELAPPAEPGGGAGDLSAPRWSDAGVVTFAVDRGVWSSAFKAQERLQAAVWPIYGRTVRVLTWACGLSLLVLLVHFRHAEWGHPAYLITVLLAVVIAARVAVFAVIDASSWHAGDDLRYLLPILPLFPVAALVLLDRAARVAWRRGAGSPAGGAASPAGLCTV